MSKPEPNSRGAPSAEVIQTYWDADIKPSQRKIESAMRADGWQISASSIIRCVKEGFAPRAGFTKGGAKSTKAVQTSPEINAIRQVQAIAPDDAPPSAVAAALVEAIQNLPTGGQKDRLTALLELDKPDIIARADKIVAAARCLLAEDLAHHTKMMMLQPDKAAKLLVVLDAAGHASVPAIMAPNGDNARVIEHNPNEPQPLSASAQALREFRMRRTSAAA